MLSIVDVDPLGHCLRHRLHERGFICNRIDFAAGYTYRLHDTDRDCY